MNTPSIKQMRYLVALREYKSFSIAAEKCFVTQSTLSAGIKELEKLLGQSVVDRRLKAISLTPFGLEMANEAEIILARAKNMTDRAQQLKSPMSGVFRLGVIPTIAPYLLPNILPRIQKSYPLLELQLYEDLSGRLIEKANAGQIDTILMAFPYDTPNMVQRPLFEEPFTLACPKGQMNDIHEIEASDLQPNELLLLEDGHCLRDHAMEACGLQGVEHKKEFSTTSLATLLQMVASGYGMTLLPDMASTKNLIPKGVRTIPFSAPQPTRQIGLAWRRGSAKTIDFEALAEIIAAPA